MHAKLGIENLQTSGVSVSFGCLHIEKQSPGYAITRISDNRYLDKNVLRGWK